MTSENDQVRPSRWDTQANVVICARARALRVGGTSSTIAIAIQNVIGAGVWAEAISKAGRTLGAGL